MAPPQQEDPRLGTFIGAKWRVDALLGSGSMASVYAVTHRNGSRAALKILHENLASDVSVCERFLGEGYLTNSIKHDGIVRVFDDGMTDDGCPFLAMDLLEGETLDVHRTKAGGKLAMFETIEIADKVMDTLAAVHQAGIIHRDLKPQNVFCENDGGVRLLDFGVARLQERINSHSIVGMVLGTPSFMSPEQALGGKDVDARSDIWALGAIMFTLLTGETVHVAGNIQARLLAAASVRARSVLVAAPQLPQDIALVIDTALQFKKEERWQTVNAMRAALRNVKQSLPPPGLVDEAFDSIRQVSFRPPQHAGLAQPAQPAHMAGGQAHQQHPHSQLPQPGMRVQPVQFQKPQPHMAGAGGYAQTPPPIIDEGPPDPSAATTVAMTAPSELHTSAPPIERVAAAPPDKRLKTVIGMGPMPEGVTGPLPRGVPVPPAFAGGNGGHVLTPGAGFAPGGGPQSVGPSTARGLGEQAPQPHGQSAVEQLSRAPDPRRAPYESLVSAAESASVPAAFGNTNAVWAEAPPLPSDDEAGRRRIKIVVSVVAMFAAAAIAFAAVAFIKKSADARQHAGPGTSAGPGGSGTAPGPRLGAPGDPGAPLFAPLQADGGRAGALPTSLPQGGNGGGVVLPNGNAGGQGQGNAGGLNATGGGSPWGRVDGGGGVSASDAGSAGGASGSSGSSEDGGSIELW